MAESTARYLDIEATANTQQLQTAKSLPSTASLGGCFNSQYKVAAVILEMIESYTIVKPLHYASEFGSIGSGTINDK